MQNNGEQVSKKGTITMSFPELLDAVDLDATDVANESTGWQFVDTSSNPFPELGGESTGDKENVLGTSTFDVNLKRLSASLMGLGSPSFSPKTGTKDPLTVSSLSSLPKITSALSGKQDSLSIWDQLPSAPESTQNSSVRHNKLRMHDTESTIDLTNFRNEQWSELGFEEIDAGYDDIGNDSVVDNEEPIYEMASKRVGNPDKPSNIVIHNFQV